MANALLIHDFVINLLLMWTSPREHQVNDIHAQKEKVRLTIRDSVVRWILMAMKSGCMVACHLA